MLRLAGPTRSFLLLPFFFLFLCHCALHSQNLTRRDFEAHEGLLPSLRLCLNAECRAPSALHIEGLKSPAPPAGWVLLGDLLR